MDLNARHKSQWITRYILFAIFLISTNSCSDKNSGIEIILPEYQRLEHTAAGWWISELGLHYDAQSKYITDQIHDLLIARARLINRYNESDDKFVAIWQYYGKNKSVIIKEETNKDIIWMSYEYPPPGVPWKEIIPFDYQRLKPNRKYEHGVTINSVTDKGARLFLFGWGDYCTRIDVF
jgi:hypothetical protein